MKGDVIIQTCVFLLLTIQGIEPANKTKSGAIYVNQAHQPLFNFKCFSCQLCSSGSSGTTRNYIVSVFKYKTNTGTNTKVLRIQIQKIQQQIQKNTDTNAKNTDTNTKDTDTNTKKYRQKHKCNYKYEGLMIPCCATSVGSDRLQRSIS